MIHVLHSGMTGAPVLTGQAGKLIDVLDACLVNGWGTATVDSVVISGGIATVTRAAGNPFEVDSVAEISGATVSGGSINGLKKVLTRTATTYTFDATGIPNQTATGTISHKVAPLGWVKQYSGANLAAYKSVGPGSGGALLRVDDTGTTSARVVGYESMSDVNTGTGPFPTAAQISGGGYWTKSQTADAAARQWVLVGDGERFYLTIVYYFTNAVTSFFGETNPRKAADGFKAALACQTFFLSTSGASSADMFHVNTATVVPMYMPRGVTGTGGSVSLFRSTSCAYGNLSGQASGSSSFQPFPNLADGALILSPMTLSDPLCYRAEVPGAYYCPQSVGSGFQMLNKVEGVTGLPDRRLLAIFGGSSGLGCGFLDITGPW